MVSSDLSNEHCGTPPALVRPLGVGERYAVYDVMASFLVEVFAAGIFIYFFLYLTCFIAYVACATIVYCKFCAIYAPKNIYEKPQTIQHHYPVHCWC